MWELAFFSLCFLTGSAATDVQGSSGDCYQISTLIMIGIVVGDILLTVFLLIPVYYCTRRKGKILIKKGEASNYVNMPGIRG